MKNLEKFIVFILMFCFASNIYAQNNSLTLSQALKYAVANNELLQASAKSKQFSQYELKAAKGKYLPTVFLDASVNRIDEDINIDVNSIRTALIGASVASYQGAGGSDSVTFRNMLNGSLPDFVIKVQDELFYKFSAGLTWPLYTGGKISANSKAKKLELNIADAEYERTLNSTITSVIESYFKAKLAQEARDIRYDYLNNIKQHSINANKLFKVGMISKSNKLRVDVALAQADTEYKKSERDFELALVVLSNIIGTDAESADLVTDFNKIENLKPLVFYSDTAYANNITLKNMHQKKDMVKQKKKAVLSDFLPTIAAFGKYEIYKENLTILEPEWAAGLNARLNIFNGGSDYNEYKAYSTQLEIIDLYIENINKMIDTAVKKYHHEAVTALEQYESLKSSQALTEENLKLYRKSFKEGLAISIEVIDAELAMEKVRLDRSQALFDYNVAYAKLMDICGKSQNLMENINGN